MSVLTGSSAAVGAGLLAEKSLPGGVIAPEEAFDASMFPGRTADRAVECYRMRSPVPATDFAR